MSRVNEFVKGDPIDHPAATIAPTLCLDLYFVELETLRLLPEQFEYRLLDEFEFIGP